jgi:hypothetical protein
VDAEHRTRTISSFGFDISLSTMSNVRRVCVLRGLAATGILSAPGSRDDVHFKSEGTTGKTGTQSKGEL